MSENQETNHYDLIVIGSGMGSLTTASLMASVGKKRVLVLESGPKLGGFLHSFRRDKYNWEPGLHYVSGMDEGNLNRRCMDLVTGGKARWHQMSNYFENFMFPEENFKVASDVKQFEQDLITRFPEEEKNIVQYFKDMNSLLGWSTRWYISKQFPKPLASLVSAGRKLAKRNTKEYLDELFDNDLLKAILAAQWPDFGTPPSESALGFHAIIATAFYTGGYFPIGGPDSIIEGAVEQIEKQGGKCLRRHEVEEILIENNKAYGVRVAHKKGAKEFFAPKIVSGAGITNTFEKMVPENYAIAEREKVRNSIAGPSSLIVFLGLNDDPKNHGFEDCNYWMYARTDHIQNKAEPGEIPPVDGAFLSFGSLRDPESTSYTAQIVTFSNESEWSEFKDSDWKRRGEKYESQKDQITDEVIDFVEQYAPGLKDLIAYKELSTPLTVKSFLNHPHGQIYGRACTEDRMGDNEFSIGTSVKNLYLTGTDLVNPGIDAALMTGVMTASKLLGWIGMPRVMSSAYFNNYKKAS